MRVVPRLEPRLSEHRRRDTRPNPEATATGRRSVCYEGLVPAVCFVYEGNDRWLTLVVVGERRGVSMAA